MMLNKLHGRPAWYKIWTVATALIAIYVIIKFFGIILVASMEEATKIDFILAAYVQLSVLLDMYIFPQSDKSDH